MSSPPGTPPGTPAGAPPGALRISLPDGRIQVLPEEVAVALVFDGTTQAVMMATPGDLEDFLLGFAVCEGLIAGPADLTGIEVVQQPRGIEVRGWLAGVAGIRFMERRRAMAGPVGCGLCGIDSLDQALRPLVRAPGGAAGGGGGARGGGGAGGGGGGGAPRPRRAGA